MMIEDVNEFSAELNAQDKELALELERDIKERNKADQCLKKQKHMNV